MNHLKTLLRVSAVALALGTTAVEAANISSLLITGPNVASDENREYLINRNGGSPTVIDVGDSLRGFLAGRFF